MNLNENSQSATSNKLLAVAREVALQIEVEGSCNLLFQEPPYHNRLHFADVLTTITIQVAIESAHWQQRDDQWQAAMILIAIAHDLRHPGRMNRDVAEIEQISVDALQPYLQKNAVPVAWIKRINRIILSSDFSLTSKNHKRVFGKTFAWNADWAIVLLNESDIMTSVLEEFGSQLGLALASEWALASFPAHNSVATQQGRLDFLATTLFSSYSSITLGALSERNKQLSEEYLLLNKIQS